MMEILVRFLSGIIKEKFTGSIELHFFQGNISTVKKVESFKL